MENAVKWHTMKRAKSLEKSGFSPSFLLLELQTARAAMGSRFGLFFGNFCTKGKHGANITPLVRKTVQAIVGAAPKKR